MRLVSNEVVPGLLWWGVRGARPPSSKKTVGRGSPGRALKFGQVLVNVFRKRFARGVSMAVMLCNIFMWSIIMLAIAH